MQDYYKQFETCREHDIPACADVCPFRMDVIALQDKIVKERFNAAYKTIRDAVVFPGIVSEICPAYCENACIRKDIDAPVQIKSMERSVIANTTRKTPNRYNLPARKKTVAVVGAGLSGMGFAFRMASKKYPVTILEKTGRIGGHLAEIMDEEKFIAEFELQFQNEEYELRLDTEINDIKTLCKNADPQSRACDDGETFDIIYVATGKDGETFGIPMPETAPGAGSTGGCMKIGDTAVFIGGEVCGKDLMHGLADGIGVAACAESFLKTGKLEYPAQPKATKCVPNEDILVETSPVIPLSGDLLSGDECKAEAERCIKCKCDACAVRCDLVSYFDKMPVKMRDEIFLSCKPAGSLVHKSPARKYVAACTMCGLMTEECPEHIDLCGMIKFARHKMHEAGKVPAAYRQYFMRDMAFANGELAALKKSVGGPGKYAFFPGCNLGALDPDYVIKPYRWLLEKQPDTSILLRCCSIPVDWDGNTEQHQNEITSLKNDWEDLGKPILIMACMSCQKHIREYLPEIETVSLYEILQQWGFDTSEAKGAAQDGPYAIFDPCSARHENDVRSSVRSLLSAADISANELPKGDRHGCCGFGGMGNVAVPEFSEYVAKKRIELSDDPYVVYCSNCKDIFCDRGKRAVHILDILFDIDPKGIYSQPDLTQRRANRVRLKKRLLEEIWKEKTEMKSYESKYPLTMKDEIREKVNKQKILEEDICEVIDHAEKTGRRTFIPATGHYRAYKEIGNITCWVEYTPLDFGYEIHNLYTHRMKIELEAVWNGRKTDL